MPGRWGAAVTLMFWSIPSAASASTRVSQALDMGAGVLGLLVAGGLLVGMLSLNRIARGSAIADNISYGVLAVLCLAASLLSGWISRWLAIPLSADTARLGADLLSVVALVFFAIYFWRVRTAMTRFLDILTGEAQLLTAVVRPDIEQD